VQLGHDGAHVGAPDAEGLREILERDEATARLRSRESAYDVSRNRFGIGRA
jgi:hypothetical protein